MANLNNTNGYILNINTGTLHTKECGDSAQVCGPAVTAGSRKPFSSYTNATNDASYSKDHESDSCFFYSIVKA